MPTSHAAYLEQHEHEPEWPFVLLMGGLMVLASISTDLYLPALPAMARALNATPAAAQGTLAAFLAGMGFGQFFYGPLSDRVGRRPALLLGVAIFSLGTAACALAPSIQALVAARFAQAFGACAAHVVPRALIRDRFELRTSAQIFSRLTIAAGASPMLGPLIGGHMSVAFGWRSVFFIPGLFALLIGGWIFWRVEESLTRSSMLRARGEPVFSAIWGLLRQRALMGYVLCGATNAAVFFAYLTAAPELLIEIYRIPPERFGYVFAINAIGFIAVNQLNARLLRRYSPLTILVQSRLPTVLIGALLCVSAYTGWFGMLGVLVPLFFALASGGLIGANTSACALHLDPTRAGSISSLIGAGAFAFGALASVLAGLFHDGTARPMATLIVLCMVASAISLFVIAKPSEASS